MNECTTTLSKELNSIDKLSNNLSYNSIALGIYDNVTRNRFALLELCDKNYIFLENQRTLAYGDEQYLIRTTDVPFVIRTIRSNFKLNPENTDVLRKRIEGYLNKTKNSGNQLSRKNQLVDMINRQKQQLTVLEDLLNSQNEEILKNTENLKKMENLDDDDTRILRDKVWQMEKLLSEYEILGGEFNELRDFLIQSMYKSLRSSSDARNDYINTYNYFHQLYPNTYDYLCKFSLYDNSSDKGDVLTYPTVVNFRIFIWLTYWIQIRYINSNWPTTGLTGRSVYNIRYRAQWIYCVFAARYIPVEPEFFNKLLYNSVVAVRREQIFEDFTSTDFKNHTIYEYYNKFRPLFLNMPIDSFKVITRTILKFQNITGPLLDMPYFNSQDKEFKWLNEIHKKLITH